MRVSWDEYFITMATQVATRGTCDRLRVGAVLVRDNSVISTGYNGSIIGTPHCDDIGHLVVNGSCIRTIHAEGNALATAGKSGVSTLDTTLYVTHKPCWACYRTAVNSGVIRIIYRDPHGGAYPTLGPVLCTQLNWQVK